MFGRLLIATGSRARRINGENLDSISKGLQVNRTFKAPQMCDAVRESDKRWRSRNLKSTVVGYAFCFMPLNSSGKRVHSLRGSIARQAGRRRAWFKKCVSVAFHESRRPASGELLLHSPPGHRWISSSMRFPRQVRFWLRALRTRLRRYSEACTCYGQS